MSDKAFTVLYWGSHPDEDNDDCFTGHDFDTKEEAIAFFQGEVQDPPGKLGYYLHDVAFVEIDGIEDTDLALLDIKRVRQNPSFQAKKSHQDDGEWQREIANQAGMEFGIHGYNDAMGYDSEPYEG